MKSSVLHPPPRVHCEVLEEHRLTLIGMGWTPPGNVPKPAPWPGAPTGFKLNTAGSVAVATTVFWNPNMDECPRGVKVQLLGKGGVATYGTFNGTDTFWTDWAPVPQRRPK